MSTKEDIAERRAANAVGAGGTKNDMPDRGTSTGLNGDTYGADISGNATNTLATIASDGGTGSDMAAETCPGEC